MTYDNKTTLQTPLIGKVVILNKYILDKKPLPSKTIQLNSYTGSLCHCADYNKQKLMVRAVFSKGYGKYLYFKHKPNKIICVLKDKYTSIGKSERDLRQVNKYILTSKNKRYDSNSCKKERKALRGCKSA